MNDTLVIALPRFLTHAERIATFLGADVREYTPDLFVEIFPHIQRIVAVMSMGIVVRKIAPLIKDKWTDPAVVVVSSDFAFAIPVLGGHHGANELAKELAALGIQPVITTATETMGRQSAEAVAHRFSCEIVNRESTRLVNSALLDADVPVYTVQGPGVVIAGHNVSVLIRSGRFTVGIGCRKGVKSAEVLDAIRTGLSETGVTENDVFVYATTQKKLGENGLIRAVSALSGNLIFLDDDTINAQAAFSPSRATNIGLSGVAEPCALAVARKKELVMTKKVYGRVTIAIAR